MQILKEQASSRHRKQTASQEPMAVSEEACARGILQTWHRLKVCHLLCHHTMPRQHPR